MYVFEKILSEIDNGIKTIEPLMKGETRQIAESQIIGLEEARRIVEKYKDDAGWIPVEKRLPDEEWETYITSHEDGSVQIHSYTHKDGFVFNWDTDKPNSKVVAWRAMPDPYRPKEDK